MAFKALDISDQMNEVNTQYLLIKRIREYSGITCLQIAVSANCIEFLSHKACQNLLVKIWYNKVLPDTSKLNVRKI